MSGLSVILTVDIEACGVDSLRDEPRIPIEAGTVLDVHNPRYDLCDYFECVEPETGAVVWVHSDDCDIYSDGAP